MKILIVDDQQGARRLLRQTLSSVAGAELLEADGAEAALATVASSLPDLVLLDLRLTDEPDEHVGLAVLAKLRARFPDVDVVVVTAVGTLGTVRAALKLGACDYIHKDELSAEVLLPLVRALDEKHALRSEVHRLRAMFCDGSFCGDCAEAPALGVPRAAMARRAVETFAEGAAIR